LNSWLLFVWKNSGCIKMSFDPVAVSRSRQN
jgi:hypothetical protein